MARFPWILLALAALLRCYGCVLTPVPGRDGVHYLWLAEALLRDGPAALCETVFHPFYPVLTALALVAGNALPGEFDPIHAGQLAAALPATLAAVPLWRLTLRLFDARIAWWTTLLYAVGNWLVRHPAECLSEGPFFLLVTASSATLVGRRNGSAAADPAPTVAGAALAGTLAGLAFLTRPEGFGLVVTGAIWLLAARRHKVAMAFALSGTLVSLLLPLGMLANGHGFTLTPKAAFNWDVGAGAAGTPMRHYFEQWLRWPGDAWEGLGYLTFPLLVFGAIRHRPRRLSDPRLLLLAPFLAQVAIVPLLKSHHRFASGLGVLLLPFAGAVFVALLDVTRRRATAARERSRPVIGCGWQLTPVLLLVLAAGKLLVNPPTDRTIERDLGRWLRAIRPATATIASDMPRLLYFAGLRPPPPRRIDAAELLAQATAETCRFVVQKRGRTAVDRAELTALGYREALLPASLANHPHATEILLLQR
ncbi:MAG: hypothetical protein NXI31_21230 [bacterium]|nr:hypothetical protein [bacterium]